MGEERERKMDQKKNKELKEAYKAMKTQMGIVFLQCKENGQEYLWAVQDTRGKVNGLRARLNGNMYRGSRNKKIQEEWNKYGEAAFEIKVLDILEYDEEELKTDYTEELEMLLEDWEKQYPQALRIQ